MYYPQQKLINIINYRLRNVFNYNYTSINIYTFKKNYHCNKNLCSETQKMNAVLCIIQQKIFKCRHTLELELLRDNSFLLSVIVSYFDKLFSKI